MTPLPFAAPVRTADRARPESKSERRYFAQTRRAESQYARALRSVATRVGQITKAFDPTDVAQSDLLRAALDKYSYRLRPWAEATAARMLADVSRRDEHAWAELSKTMSRALRKEIRTAPTGQFLRSLLNENVDLITSLPREAGERVHELTLRALESSARAAEVAKEIGRTGQVTRSRANLIARTEVARTASGLVEARSLHVGSEGYIWRTAEDSDVRPLHKKLNGRYFRWDDPPVAGSSGERAHAGQIYNCRCYPEPVIPEESE